jgi:3'-phosphoadenosine 5'-phosphosulfate (PAPS) 3'-phosphatase
VNRTSEILDILIEAVTAGTLEVLAVKRAGDVGAHIKHGRELVTEADQRSDAAILKVFTSRFPGVDPAIRFHLEESGLSGDAEAVATKIAGADPLDGTNIFACGSNLYAIQAHYVEDGIPLAGVVFQPEVYLPLDETERCIGRLVTAIRGEGAFTQRSEFTGNGFVFSNRRRLERRPVPDGKAWVACIPYGTKMGEAGREAVRRVQESGVIASTTGAGGAAANVMMVIFGAQHVYGNFGAGDALDLIPPQVIALEAGFTVWNEQRTEPVWHVHKQPFIVAPNAEIADLFLTAAGF